MRSGNAFKTGVGIVDMMPDNASGKLRSDNSDKKRAPPEAVPVPEDPEPKSAAKSPTAP